MQLIRKGKTNVEALLYFEDNQWTLDYYFGGELTITVKVQSLDELLAYLLNCILGEDVNSIEDAKISVGWDNMVYSHTDLGWLIEEVFNPKSPLHQKDISSDVIFDFLIATNPDIYVPPQEKRYIHWPSVFEKGVHKRIDLEPMKNKARKEHPDWVEKQIISYVLMGTAKELQMEVQVQKQYFFDSTNQLVFWLIDQTIDTRHLKCCDICGRFFVSRRSSAKYCSDKCRIVYANEHSFGDEYEIKTLYHQIASNIQKKKANRKGYIGPDGACCNLEEIHKNFRDTNRDYRKKLKTAHEAKLMHSCETNQEYECIKAEYIAWLTEQHALVKSIKRDYDL